MRGTCAALAAHYMRRKRPGMEHLCAVGVDNNNNRKRKRKMKGKGKVEKS